MISPAGYLRSSLRHTGLMAQAMLSLLVPPLCLICERRVTAEERWLCRSCRIALAARLNPGIRRVELNNGRRLEVRFALAYDMMISKLIAEMKYGDKPGLAGLLTPMLLNALGDVGGGDGLVVPVPMHPSKRRERGYNQSELLGLALARTLGLKYRDDILVKLRRTQSQTALGEAARLGNVVGSIGLGCRSSPGPRRVIIVDDVVTTGATLRECTEAIAPLGIEETVACVIASS
jgi:ComF family protein